MFLQSISYLKNSQIGSNYTQQNILYKIWLKYALFGSQRRGCSLLLRGGTPPAVIEIFWKFFSLKMPLNASKVPKELFNPYQNVKKNIGKNEF